MADVDAARDALLESLHLLEVRVLKALDKHGEADEAALVQATDLQEAQVRTALGWLLGLHAGWVGRRVAAQLGGRTELAVRDAIVRDAFAGLTRVEEARQTIAAAATSA